MNIPNKVTLLALALVAVVALGIGPAVAHRFNVALVVPRSDGAFLDGRDIRDGFMLATAERDSHPDQESDGHLGGLDIYVTVIGSQGNITAEIERIARQREVDIVVAFGSEETRSMVQGLLDGTRVVLLLPGQPTLSWPGSPAEKAFNAAYEQAYGYAPTSRSAQGYIAARHIDAAVRAQGGVDDTAALRQVLDETARDFVW